MTLDEFLQKTIDDFESSYLLLKRKGYVLTGGIEVISFIIKAMQDSYELGKRDGRKKGGS